MKVSINWLKELIDLKVPVEELVRLLPLRTIGTKEITEDFIELDMKGYNRADLLSMRGIAYEVAAITDSELIFKEPLEGDFIWNQQKLPETPCEIEDEALCALQGIAKIEGLKIGPSKDEWVKKLADSGMRSVNNVVDVTNLIMLEYGQPLHSFDASTIKDETINVRVAKAGEEITTLDGKLRKLDTSDIVLADTKGPIDVAGVMGGKNTETSDSTNTILLTASFFNPQMIMKTTHKLGLYSEASKRFQHGLTKKRLLQSFNAAIKMYESLGGKLTAINLVGNQEDKLKTITLTQSKINSLIGVEISAKEVEESLKKLGFFLTSQDNGWEVTVPYWRLDIDIEDDLVEEVARLYGYEKIPATELKGELPTKIDQKRFEFLYQLKTDLAGSGLTEVQTYSFYSTQVLNNLNLDKNNLVKLLNPISAETEYLKDKLWPNLLEVTAKNIKNGIKDIAIFEIGKTYFPAKGEMPEEKYHLSITLSNGTDNPIAELYQIAKKLNLNLEGAKIEPRDYFHPTRYTDGLAEIHPRFVNKFGTEQRVAVLEIDLIKQL